jgi:hypothetical protein
MKKFKKLKRKEFTLLKALSSFERVLISPSLCKVSRLTLGAVILMSMSSEDVEIS